MHPAKVKIRAQQLTEDIEVSSQVPLKRVRDCQERAPIDPKAVYEARYTKSPPPPAQAKSASRTAATSAPVQSLLTADGNGTPSLDKAAPGPADMTFVPPKETVALSRPASVPARPTTCSAIAPTTREVAEQDPNLKPYWTAKAGGPARLGLGKGGAGASKTAAADSVPMLESIPGRPARPVRDPNAYVIVDREAVTKKARTQEPDPYQLAAASKSTGEHGHPACLSRISIVLMM